MSTCKDCLHFDVCEAVRGRPDLVGKNSLRIAEKHCPYNSFSDKSEWVHLPCKVGDVVYCYEPCFGSDHNPKLKVVEKEIVELKTIATVFGLNFDIDSIGKTIFLTREEAEKALDKQRETLNGGKTND